MRLPGYCESCHHFKNVRVEPRMLAMLQIPGAGTPVGVCWECEEEDRARGTRRKV